MSGTLSHGDTGNPMATGTLWFTFVDIAFSTGTTLNADSWEGRLLDGELP